MAQGRELRLENPPECKQKADDFYIQTQHFLI